MQLFIVTILLFLFAVGILVTLYLNKGSEAHRAKERWIKLLFYFLILAIVFSCIHFDQSQPLAISIGIMGLYELVRAHVQFPRSIVLFCSKLMVYILVLLAFIQCSSKTSTDHLFFIYFIVVTFDGFSQLCGQLFGKRKIAPKISPNKTLEGLIGGLLFAICGSLFLVRYMSIPPGQVLLIAVLICVSALLGDLLASWYKRRYQLKDYSTLIPGHGGILDRFDSFIFSGAIYWFVYL